MQNSLISDHGYLPTRHISERFQTHVMEREKRSRQEEDQDPIEIAASILLGMAEATSDGFNLQPMTLADQEEEQPFQRKITCLSMSQAEAADDISSSQEDCCVGERTDPSQETEEKRVKKTFTATPANEFFHGKIKFFDENNQILFLTIIAEANKRKWHEAKQIGNLLTAYAIFISAAPKSKADREYSSFDEQTFLERIASILLKQHVNFATEFEFTKAKLEKTPGCYNVTASKIITLATSIEGKLIDPILQRGYDQDTFSALITAGYDNLFAAPVK